MLGQKNNPEKMFVTVSLENMVPEDNFYRRLDNILDLRFLYKECERFYGKTGNPSIDPVVFFKSLIYRYFENIISDRELIRTLNDSLSGRYFLRYDLDEKLPTHSSISRTRKLLGEELFEGIFTRVVEMCVKSGMVSGTHQSIDSTLVKANASMENLVRKEPQLEVMSYIKKSREENEGTENPPKSNLQIAPKEKNETKTRKNKNKIYTNTTDPDSRIASKPHTLTDMYYKTQISVDSQKNIITEVNTYRADDQDVELLIDTVDRTVERLESMGKKVNSIGADKGYVSGENLKELERREITSYMPIKHTANKTGLYEQSEFKYDEISDCYICPNGKRLEFTSIDKQKKVKVYLGKKKRCAECPLRSKCTTSKGSRKVTLHMDWKEYGRLDVRMQSSQGRKAMRTRKTGPEPVFGDGKEHHGLRKFMTRGLDKAKKNSYIIATVINLKKLMKYCDKRKKEMALPITNEINALLSSINNILANMASLEVMGLKY